MLRKSTSRSGMFTTRAVFACTLFSVALLLGTFSFFSFASNPTSGTITESNHSQSYTAGPFNVSNQTPVIELDSGPECHAGGAPGGDQAQPCDDYALTVTLPQGFTALHPAASIKVSMFWTDAGAGQSDYDLYIYKNPRNDCNPTDCTETSGSQAADYQSASGANPEAATIPVAGGHQNYTILVVPFTSNRA